MKYRRDVDGLRAIAVLSVVAYHAAEAWVPGGFIGVDIFFVISGYLITGLLLKDLRQQSFSIAQFYLRRSRRILPALFACAAVTTVLATFLLAPKELRTFGPTLAGTFAFVSNIIFWRSTDYFQANSEATPLLHVWSLAVEEQFYLLWPIGIALLAKTRFLWPGLIGLLVSSFALSTVAMEYDPQAAFYLLPSRAWELLGGAAIAVSARPIECGRPARSVLAGLGLALIGISLMWLDRTSPFPGWNALIPCLGAVMLILAGEGVGNPVSERILTSRPLVFVGLISYSLYLWHWPLLSLARITQHGVLTAGQTAGVLAVVAVMAIASWRFVETPFRHVRPSSSRTPLLGYLAVSMVFVAAGFVVPGMVSALRPADGAVARIEEAALEVNPRQGACLRNQGQSGPLPGMPCVIGGERANTLVVWGDSHASGLMPGFDTYAAARGVASYQLTMIACPPLIDVEVRERRRSYAGCNAFNRMVIDYIEATPAVSTVVLAARWSLYDGGPRFGPDDQGEPVSIVVSGDVQDRTQKGASGFAEGLTRTVTRLRRAGRAVVVIGSIPPMGVNVPNCLVRNLMRWSSMSSCDQDARPVLSALSRVDGAIAEIGDHVQGVCTYLPAPDLCATGRCVSRFGEIVLYADDDHLTAPGAALVVERLSAAGCQPRE